MRFLQFYESEEELLNEFNVLYSKKKIIRAWREYINLLNILYPNLSNILDYLNALKEEYLNANFDRLKEMSKQLKNVSPMLYQTVKVENMFIMVNYEYQFMFYTSDVYELGVESPINIRMFRH